MPPDPEKLKWTESLENEYQDVRKLMKRNLRLFPYEPESWLNLVIDSSSTRGVGFVLLQLINEDSPGEGATIVQANSSLLPPNVGLSPMDG